MLRLGVESLGGGGGSFLFEEFVDKDFGADHFGVGAGHFDLGLLLPAFGGSCGRLCLGVV